MSLSPLPQRIQRQRDRAAVHRKPDRDQQIAALLVHRRLRQAGAEIKVILRFICMVQITVAQDLHVAVIRIRQDLVPDAFDRPIDQYVEEIQAADEPDRPVQLLFPLCSVPVAESEE